MSRSYKKHPCLKDVKSGKKGKKFANQKVRTAMKNHSVDIPSGSSYRKMFDAWEIYEYKFYMTKKDVYIYWHQEERIIQSGGKIYGKHKTLREEYQDWYKRYIRK